MRRVFAHDKIQACAYSITLFVHADYYIEAHYASDIQLKSLYVFVVAKEKNTAQKILSRDQSLRFYGKYCIAHTYINNRQYIVHKYGKFVSGNRTG